MRTAFLRSSGFMFRIMSLADIRHMAAWSPLLSFVHKRAKKEYGERLVGGTGESVGMVASRRAVIPRGEVASMSLLFVIAAVPGDEVEGEAIVVCARQREGGKTQRTWRVSTVGKGPGVVVSRVCRR